MSSRELLVVIAGLPAESEYKKATERTFRVLEYTGPDTMHEGQLVATGQLILTPAIGRILDECELVEEFVDWTFDQKLAARMVREQIVDNGYTDFSGVTEPLSLVLERHQANKNQKVVDQVENLIRGGLYGFEKVKGGE